MNSTTFRHTLRNWHARQSALQTPRLSMWTMVLSIFWETPTKQRAKSVNNETYTNECTRGVAQNVGTARQLFLHVITPIAANILRAQSETDSSSKSSQRAKQTTWSRVLRLASTLALVEDLRGRPDLDTQINI